MGYSPLPVRRIATALTACAVFYFSILGLLIVSPSLQAHIFYLHRAGPSFLWDANVPEQFGFLPRQVSPFYLHTRDGETLHAWHVLPLGAYLSHQDALLAPNAGLQSSHNNSMAGQDLISSIASPNPAIPDPLPTSLRILQSDPDAFLVIYFHGVAGNIASGYRPGSYRALSSAAPDKIHLLAFDYRGYGRSTGFPSEAGLLTDGIAAVDWALRLGIPPSRIIIYGQSLGTAVAVSVSQHFASQSPPVTFAGQVLTAPFSDVATLTATYRIAGVVPVLSPLAGFPRLLAWLNSFLASTWRSADRLADLIARSARYHVTLIHGEDDATIAPEHSNVLFWRMAGAAQQGGVRSTAYDAFARNKARSVVAATGHAGWVAELETARGTIRQEMLRYGPHNRIMSYPVGGAAVLRTMQAALRDRVVVV